LAAIQLCGEQGHHRVIFMGDAKSVVDVVNSEEQDWSRGGNVTEAIRAQLRSHPCWSFTYSCREANRAAHAVTEPHRPLAPPKAKDIIFFSQKLKKQKQKIQGYNVVYGKL
jgi:hypothetical protein